MAQRVTDVSDFHVILFSNESMNYYPQNTLSLFTNKLANSCRLETGVWSVGLFEISFNDFTFDMQNDAYIISDDDDEAYVNSLCCTRKRRKRGLSDKIKIEISASEVIEFSLKDVTDIAASNVIEFEIFLKNMDSFIIKAPSNTMDVVKLNIRKQLDVWITDFHKNKMKSTVHTPKMKEDGDCILKLYNDKEAVLKFPSSYTTIGNFMDDKS